MSLSDLFWVFFIMIALQPMLRQRVLMALYEQPVRTTPMVEYLPSAPRTPPRRP